MSLRQRFLFAFQDMRAGRRGSTRSRPNAGRLALLLAASGLVLMPLAAPFTGSFTVHAQDGSAPRTAPTDPLQNLQSQEAPAGRQDEAGDNGCAVETEILQNNAYTVQINIKAPCRANSMIRFEHNGDALTRFADAEGRIRLLRLLAGGSNRIIMIDQDQPVLLFDQAEEPAGQTASTTPADDPVEQPPDNAGQSQVGVQESRDSDVAAIPAVDVDSRVDSGIDSGADPGADQENANKDQTGPDKPCGQATIDHHFNGPTLELQITLDCEQARSVRVDYRERGWSFYETFEPGKPLTLAFVPVDPVITLDVAIEGLGYQRLSVNPDGLADGLAVLIWDAPIDLQLIVREPGMPPASADIIPDPVQGRIVLRDDGDHTGTKMEAYAVAADQLDRPAVIGLAVRNVSRSPIPSGEHCETGQYAQTHYRIFWRIEGRTRERRFVLTPAACGVALDAAGYDVHSLDLRFY